MKGTPTLHTSAAESIRLIQKNRHEKTMTYVLGDATPPDINPSLSAATYQGPSQDDATSQVLSLSLFSGVLCSDAHALYRT